MEFGIGSLEIKEGYFDFRIVGCSLSEKKGGGPSLLSPEIQSGSSSKVNAVPCSGGQHSLRATSFNFL
jgi:hypothetical protein